MRRQSEWRPRATRRAIAPSARKATRAANGTTRGQRESCVPTSFSFCAHRDRQRRGRTAITGGATSPGQAKLGSPAFECSACGRRDQERGLGTSYRQDQRDPMLRRRYRQVADPPVASERHARRRPTSESPNESIESTARGRRRRRRSGDRCRDSFYHALPGSVGARSRQWRHPSWGSRRPARCAHRKRGENRSSAIKAACSAPKNDERSP
jgi:hypothetical protein